MNSKTEGCGVARPGKKCRNTPIQSYNNVACFRRYDVSLDIWRQTITRLHLQLDLPGLQKNACQDLTRFDKSVKSHPSDYTNINKSASNRSFSAPHRQAPTKPIRTKMHRHLATCMYSKWTGRSCIIHAPSGRSGAL